jgi:glycosyltransferase involved in cell wall biosynthesis
MRVTMLVRCLAMMRGGGETRHLAWMRELASLGVEVDVITGQPLALGGMRHPVSGVKATVLRTPYLRDAVYRWQHTTGFGRLTANALHFDETWFCDRAWQQIAARRDRPDIVHAHALYQAARGRRHDLPVVINFPGEPNPRYHGDITMADTLIADGWAAAHLPKLLGREVRAVPKGVDAELFRPSGANKRSELKLDGKHVILSVGRFVPIKNMALLVDAMAQLKPADVSAHLVLVGEGPELAMLRERAERLGVARAVTFAGYVDHHDLGPYFRTADVFALPSDFDNSPNVVLEAMACGLPVVATDVGGVAEYVRSGRGGDLVPKGDATQMAGALGDWLTDAPRRREAAAFNRQRVVQEFSWRASATRLLEIYRETIDRRAAAMKASA